MELDLSVVGVDITPPPFDYTWKNLSLYALGIGASINDLDFTWEGHTGFRAYPSFAVIPTQPIIMEALGRVNADYRKLVHGAQTITMHAPIPKAGTMKSVGRIREVQDKGKGAVVIIETTTTDGAGNALFDTEWSIFCRGQGDFGGERGASVPLPEAAPNAEPVIDTTVQTRPDQALLYRLSGDFNPLHVDPGLATKVGFTGPILHGLCTYGFTVRQVVSDLCGGDPARLKRFSARFSQVVYPGDAMHIRAVPAQADDTFLLEVAVGDRTVLSHGVVELG